MLLTNTQTQFGAVTKTFHWLTAMLIVTLIPLGIIANDMPFETSDQLADKARLFSIHKTLGVVTFFVALARILWALSQPKPAPLHPDRRRESALAATVHWLLYGSLVIVPLSGWIHHVSTTGFAPIWGPLGQSLPFIPKSVTVAAVFGGIHFVVTKVLAISLILHIAGSLKHHVIDKDATLRRMLPGSPEITAPPRTSLSRAPVLAATALYALAIATGSAIGLTKMQSTPETAVLSEINSTWTVQDGTLGITIQQFENAVTGEFADWTAAIEFFETPKNDTYGTVEAQIAIASLTLGSVTKDALGPDYFDVQTFPVATYTADIVGAEDGYIAQGTLALKGAEVPVTFPFSLTIVGDTATMTGTSVIDRRDYAIGEWQTDESLIGFEVDVSISLTASRARIQ